MASSRGRVTRRRQLAVGFAGQSVSRAVGIEGAPVGGARGVEVANDFHGEEALSFCQMAPSGKVCSVRELGFMVMLVPAASGAW